MVLRTIFSVIAFSCILLRAETLQEITTEGPRPLHEALQKLEAHFGIPMLYEEIAHENAADLVNGEEIGLNPRSRYIKWRKLVVTIAQPATIESSVNDTLAAYEAERLPGTYVATSFNGMLAIVPEKMVNKAGEIVAVKSLLRMPITLPSVARTRAETLTAIITAISAKSTRRVGQLPIGEDYRRIVFSAENEPAGSVLCRMEESFGPFAVHILYDPTTDSYAANFDWLPAAEKPASTLDKRSVNDPWFVKLN